VLVIWVMLQAASGFALIFKDNIRSMSYPAVPDAAISIGVGDIYEAYDRDGAAGSLDRVIYPVKSGMPYLIRARSDNGSLSFLYVSETGALARSGLDWYTLLFSFHDHAFLPNGGRYAVAILGVAVLGFAGSGIYLWWPTRKKRALFIRWNGPPRLRYHDGHRVFGIILSPILIVSALTGLLIIFRSVILGVAAPPAKVAEVPEQYHQCVQAISDRAFLNCIDMAAGDIKDVRFPVDGERASFFIYTDDVLRPGALDNLSVEISSRTISKYVKAGDASVSTRVLDWMYPIHVGDIFGFLTELLMPLLSLAIFVLGSFSILSWSRRPR